MPTPTPPVIPPADELYRQLMSQIELDLLPENVGTLDQKYAGETSDQRAVRKQRYVEAFRKYDQALQTFTEQMKAKIKTYKRGAVQSLEEEDRTAKEGQELSSLEAALAAA